MLGLYKFFWNCGYGNVDCLFIAHSDAVKTIIGKEIYFGDILGKHSEIYGTVTERHVTLVTDNQTFIVDIIQEFGVINEYLKMFDKLDELSITLCGHNPIEYYIRNLEE